MAWPRRGAPARAPSLFARAVRHVEAQPGGAFGEIARWSPDSRQIERHDADILAHGDEREMVHGTAVGGQLYTATSAFTMSTADSRESSPSPE